MKIQIAVIALVASLAASTLLASTLVAIIAHDQWSQKKECESKLARNAHCIAGYFPMEVIEVYAGSGIEVPND